MKKGVFLKPLLQIWEDALSPVPRSEEHLPYYRWLGMLVIGGCSYRWIRKLPLLSSKILSRLLISTPSKCSSSEVYWPEIGSSTFDIFIEKAIRQQITLPISVTPSRLGSMMFLALTLVFVNGFCLTLWGFLPLVRFK
ncbi:hypothetical protein LINPERHAP2_LOCUS20061 [Linum perenne]